MRILWVVPRYGRGIVGGAETLVRALATRCAVMGWDCEVATTCAVDHVTWADAMDKGTSEEDGVRVHVPVGPRDPRRHDALHATIMAGRAGYADELEWLSQGVRSPGLQEFLEDSDHDLRVLAPYLFGTTISGGAGRPRAKRPAAVPARRAVRPPADRARRRGRGARLPVQRAGRGAPGAPALPRSRRRRGGDRVRPAGRPAAGPAATAGLGPYLVYAGRLEEGKRVNVAVEHILALASERADAPALVLMGRGGYRPPASARGRVVKLGYVGDGAKRAVYAGALALVNPSEMESLSLVLMEAWLEGTPAIVAAGSEVMADHVGRSGGGMTFASYGDFRAAVTRLLDDPGERERMGVRGRAYVLEEYGWPAVWERLDAVAGRLSG